MAFIASIDSFRLGERFKNPNDSVLLSSGDSFNGILASAKLLINNVCAFTGPNSTDYFNVCSRSKVVATPNPLAGSNFYNEPLSYSMTVTFDSVGWVDGLPGNASDFE